MSDLTILCVSQFGEHAESFVRHFAETADAVDARLVVGADAAPPAWLDEIACECIGLRSEGFIESVLDEAIAACDDGYVLRMDDDEKISRPMVRWLADGGYRDADHWAFPRLHLWPDERHYVTNAPLWPDLQTRLSVKAKAGGRTRIHQGSPHGTGRIADCPIEHWKFIVRDREERERLVAHYEGLQSGAGERFSPFSLPELFSDRISVGLVKH